MSKYNIISLDGGGVRGVITARILQRLHKIRPQMLAETHLYAGTSAGALLAVCLAADMLPADLVALYSLSANGIFPKDAARDLQTLWGLLGSKYSNEPRLKLLTAIAGDAKLPDLPKRVLIPTFDLGSHLHLAGSDPASWKAKFFHNFPVNDNSLANDRIVDIVMRSTAAPVYFPMVDGFIDGGVVANNPSMCAVAEAINPGTGKQRLTDLVLLSISTGVRPHAINCKNGDWGLEHWGFRILNLLFDADINLADYQCQQLLGSRYMRIQPQLKEDVPIDAVEKIPELIEVADNIELDGIIRWLDKQWLPNTFEPKNKSKHDSTHNPRPSIFFEDQICHDK